MGWGTPCGRTDASAAAQDLANAVRSYLAHPTTGARELLEEALNSFEVAS